MFHSGSHILSWMDKCERFRIGSQDTEAQETMHIQEQTMFSLQSVIEEG